MAAAAARQGADALRRPLHARGRAHVIAATGASQFEFLDALEILCIVPDARKAQAVRDCLEGPVTPQHPASILQRHPGTTVYLDAPSAALLTKAKDQR